jgi:hypothetical protein
MKRNVFVLAAALAVVVLVGMAPALSQDGMSKEKNHEQKWRELNTPGAQHGWLAEQAGEWSIAGKRWMPGVDEPKEVTGGSTIKMLNNRHLHEQLTLRDGTEEMKAFGLIGFDNADKQFESVYIDNMSTALAVAPGERTGDTLTFTMEKTLPEIGDVKSRVVIARKGSNEATVTIFETLGDKPEYKALELNYTRKK